MAETSGFFNARKDETGRPDRKYNANDYNNNLASIISDGVLRSGNNDLNVSLVGNIATLGIGRAWIKGHWYFNDTALPITIASAPVGERNRQDFIVIRLDNTLLGRNVKSAYVKGNEVGARSYPDPLTVITRNDDVYDIAVASITFTKSESGYNISVQDLRPNKDVCGWITSPIGYDEYFENLDNEFNQWFSNLKDELAVKTLFKRYTQHIVIEEETNIVQFNITQYDSTGVDILDIYVNGLLSIKDVDFTISENNTINFTEAKIAGTEIDVFVYKSINGDGLGSVSDEITALQNQVSTIKNISEFIYVCNGVDDNVKLSEMAQEFFNGEDNFNQMVISVYGNFKCSVPVGGNGTTTSRYRWMNLGSNGSSNKELIIDFEGCHEVVFNCEDTFSYIGIFGSNIKIKNGTFRVNHRNNSGGFTMFNDKRSSITAENCRFFMEVCDESLIAHSGTFNNCFGSIINNVGNDTMCFDLDGLLRVNGGEYYAYGINVFNSTIVRGINGAVICYAVNAPRVNRSDISAKQSHFYIKANGGGEVSGRFTDCITTLTFEQESNIIIKDKININLPSRG